MRYAELLKALSSYAGRGVDQIAPDELDTILSALAIAAAVEECREIEATRDAILTWSMSTIDVRAAELRKGAK